jgi:hypothetical protein
MGELVDRRLVVRLEVAAGSRRKYRRAAPENDRRLLQRRPLCDRMSKPPITPPVLSVADVRRLDLQVRLPDGKIVLKRSGDRMTPVVPIRDANEDMCRV